MQKEQQINQTEQIHSSIQELRKTTGQVSAIKPNQNEESSVKVQTPTKFILNQSSPTKSNQNISEQLLVEFSLELNDFECQFQLVRQAQQQMLKISLTSEIDNTLYQLTLSPSNKKQYEELNYFEDVQEIYEYISEHQGSVIQIKSQGVLLLHVVSTLGKKERKRDIILQCLKLEEHGASRELYISNTIRKMGKNIISLKHEVKLLKEKNANLQHTLQVTLENQSPMLRIKFTVDKADSHYSKYKEISPRIMKVSDNTSYYNIFHHEALPKTGIYKFRVKIVATASGNIMIGVGSKFIKNIANAYSHQDFIGFYLYGKCYVWERGNQRDLALQTTPIENGIVIGTQINLDLGYITWDICGVQVAYSVLPTELKAKLLFPVVLMVTPNDTLEFQK